MRIRENKIYAAFQDFIENHEDYCRIKFETGSDARYIEFFDREEKSIQRIVIELEHADFLKHAKDFTRWYLRMKKSELDEI